MGKGSAQPRRRLPAVAPARVRRAAQDGAPLPPFRAIELGPGAPERCALPFVDDEGVISVGRLNWRSDHQNYELGGFFPSEGHLPHPEACAACDATGGGEAAFASEHEDRIRTGFDEAGLANIRTSVAGLSLLLVKERSLPRAALVAARHSGGRAIIYADMSHGARSKTSVSGSIGAVGPGTSGGVCTTCIRACIHTRMAERLTAVSVYDVLRARVGDAEIQADPGGTERTVSVAHPDLPALRFAIHWTRWPTSGQALASLTFDLRQIDQDFTRFGDFGRGPLTIENCLLRRTRSGWIAPDTCGYEDASAAAAASTYAPHSDCPMRALVTAVLEVAGPA